MEITKNYLCLESFQVHSGNIWFSQDGGQTWTQQNQNMAYPFTLAIDIDHTTQPAVFVGSPGTGFQKASVPGNFNIDQNIKDLIKIYPNPAKNSLIISTRLNENAEIIIFAPTGQQIHAVFPVHCSGNQTIIDISTLKKGVYIIKINNWNGLLLKQ